VLFNEPKLLKFIGESDPDGVAFRFSALQRAEIAEILVGDAVIERALGFQCSSTSRNC